MYGTWQHEMALIEMERDAERYGSYVPVNSADLGGDIYDDDVYCEFCGRREHPGLSCETAAGDTFEYDSDDIAF